ncbi:MAG TPA: hypothetical protein VGD46_12195 [Rhizobacter sp.]
MSSHPTPPPAARPSSAPKPVDLAEESIAGEEDPGAALESLVNPKVNPPAPAEPTPPSSEDR